jgi:Lar family restriction alleviation protein
MKSDELKPCPFCGSATGLVFMGLYGVECKQCGAIVSFLGKEEKERLIKAYNRRAGDKNVCKNKT